jgi:hypothetical protein
MKRLLTTTLLSLACFSANAEWVLVSESLNRDFKFYADPTTRKRTGNVVRVWQLHDYAKPQMSDIKPYYSDKIYMQYDCVEKTKQTLQINSFVGRMGSGEMEGADTKPGNKIFVAPDSISEHLFNFACR